MSGKAFAPSCCSSCRRPAGANAGLGQPAPGGGCLGGNGPPGGLRGQGKSLRAWYRIARVKVGLIGRRVRRGGGSYIGTALQLAIGRNPRIFMARDRLYLDHAATTPVLPEAQAAMAVALEHWANPSSPHADGRAARAALEDARSRIAEALGWRHDVILTSGASEAISIAASRAKVPGRSRGPTEHDARSEEHTSELQS